VGVAGFDGLGGVAVGSGVASMVMEGIGGGSVGLGLGAGVGLLVVF